MLLEILLAPLMILGMIGLILYILETKIHWSRFAIKSYERLVRNIYKWSSRR